ncbi:MAG: RDD family protein [Fimbriimonadaceae bacterium]|nr:RDD family protein [Fimbriimonadaceae bacterium]
MNHDYAVLTPDKVVVTYRLAGLGSRIGAQLLDLLIVVALIAVTTIVVSIVLPGGLSNLVASVVVVFGSLAYFTLLEGLWNGQTLGKKAARVRVRMADGTPVTFAGAFYRNLLRPADALPIAYLVGFVAIFTNEKSQRIGDLAAGTVVVHEPRGLATFTPAPYKYGEHPFEYLVGDLRGMTIEEYFAIKRLCDRFPELGFNVQEQMMREVWEPFVRRYDIPPIANVHPVYIMEAVVMKYGRQHDLL